MTTNTGLAALQQLVGDMDLPERASLFLHVHLAPLARLHAAANGHDSPEQLDYTRATADLITALQRVAQPLRLIIPTYTYRFTTEHVYDARSTASEVGRFGEEAREMFGETRTLDPVFSVVTVGEPLPDGGAIDPTSATGPRSQFAWYQHNDVVIVNLALDVIRQTQLHWYEEHMAVPYRYSKEFVGAVTDHDGQTTEVVYDYYVRDREANSTWNRERIRRELIAKGVWHEIEQAGRRYGWARSAEMGNVVLEELRADPNYLVRT